MSTPSSNENHQPDQYPQQSYDQQNHPQQGYTPQGFHQQGFHQQGYIQQGYVQPNAMSGYSQPGHPVPYAQKSKIAAALLAFFLGTFGAHNFYLGFTTKAWWQLGLTIFGWITLVFLIGGVFLLGVTIWAFVEFVMILAGGGTYRADANGVPMTA